MKLAFANDFSTKLKRGDVVEVDKIKLTPYVEGGVSVRVVNVWKRPEWLSINWFDVENEFAIDDITQRRPALSSLPERMK